MPRAFAHEQSNIRPGLVSRLISGALRKPCGGALEDVVFGDLDAVQREGVEHLLEDDDAGHDGRRAVGVQAGHLAPLLERQGGQFLEQAVKLGVHGYILKDAPPERMIRAIRAAAMGLRQIDDALLELYDGTAEPLSERERVLVNFIREGLSNAEIAETLGLSEGTIKNQISGLLARTGGKNRVEACRIAERKGWA